MPAGDARKTAYISFKVRLLRSQLPKLSFRQSLLIKLSGLAEIFSHVKDSKVESPRTLLQSNMSRLQRSVVSLKSDGFIHARAAPNW